MRTFGKVIMNADSHLTRHLTTSFSSLAKNLKPFTAKSMTLSLALFLGACASTADKPADTSAAEEIKVATQAEQPTENTSEEDAPTAAELMKTLQAPLKEPEPAKAQAKPKKEVAVKVEQKVPEKPVERVEKIAEKPTEKIEATPVVAKDSANKELEQKTPAVSAAAAKAAPAPVSKKPDEAAVQKSAEQKVSQAAERVEKPKAVPESEAVSNAKVFAVSAKQLPFTYDIWTIRKGNTTLTEGLVITTPTWEMGKEGYMSQIWLTLMEDKIHVNSSSDIETASKGLGIRIDGGDLIPFSRIAEANIGVIDGRWLDRLAQANKVDIYLGFFPGKKPTSDTFNSDLSLDNLARIVATYRILNQ